METVQWTERRDDEVQDMVGEERQLLDEMEETEEGNLLVILVVTLHRRLRSTTNLFLANLAVADLCVALFCVYQNFYIYLISSWVLGDFFCKMYQFAHSLSYTASIFILVVICTERYFGIIHPITCKQILTPTRLRLTMALVWCLSAAYSAPRFRIMKTITNSLGDGVTETICVPDRQKYDSEAFDMCNFVLLYAIPLLLMSALYARIAWGLWATTTTRRRAHHRRKRRPRRRRAKGEQADTDVDAAVECGVAPGGCAAPSGEWHPGGLQGPVDGMRGAQGSAGGAAWGMARKLRSLRRREGQMVMASCAADGAPPRAVLRARRGVVRMLVVVVLAFAVCHLPLHARKMWQYWSPAYRGDSRLSSLLTPLTFLVSYANSGINPLLYAFMSRNFRKGMWELLRCSGGSSGMGGRHRGPASTAGSADGHSTGPRLRKIPSTIRRNGSTRMLERVGSGVGDEDPATHLGPMVLITDS